MDKKTGIVVAVIGVVIVALVLLAFGLDTKVTQMGADDVLRINNDVYKKADFETFIKYTLYKNDGEMIIDENAHAADLEAGTSKEDLFLSDTLQSFYEQKVVERFVEKNNVSLTDEDIEIIDSNYESEKEKIEKFGLSKEDFLKIEKIKTISENIQNSPSQYITLPDEVYSEYVSNFSGDDLKSYTFRILQVGYTNDTVSGEDTDTTSGEIIPGNKTEKEAYMNELVARINSGEAFEVVGQSGDNRIIWAGSEIKFTKCDEEYAAGMLFKQKIGDDLYDIAKTLKAGEMTPVIDTGNEFQIALISNIEDEITGGAKDELVGLLVSEYKDQLMYADVQDVEANNSAISRIRVK